MSLLAAVLLGVIIAMVALFSAIIGFIAGCNLIKQKMYDIGKAAGIAEDNMLWVNKLLDDDWELIRTHKEWQEQKSEWPMHIEEK